MGVIRGSGMCMPQGCEGIALPALTLTLLARDEIHALIHSSQTQTRTTQTRTYTHFSLSLSLSHTHTHTHTHTTLTPHPHPHTP